MMSIAEKEFLCQIDALLLHIEVIRREDKLCLNKSIVDNDLKYIRDSLTNERLFRYRSNLISLYGFFEHFIEETVREYMSELRNLYVCYSQLPDIIKNKYFDNWRSLSTKLHYSKFSFYTPSSLADNLYQILVKDKNEILAECFVQNGGNYRHSVVCDMFRSVGIENIDSILLKYISFVCVSDPTLQAEKCCVTLDSIVDRRNEIAHGANASDIISLDMFEECLKYVCIYAKSLTLMLNDQLAEYNLAIDKSFNGFKVLHVYRSRVAVMENVSGVGLKVGEVVLVKNPSGIYPRFRNLKIQEIHVEFGDSNVEVVTELNKELLYKFVSVCVEECKVNSKFYLKK